MVVPTIAVFFSHRVVLAEYACTSGNFPTVTRVLLDKIPARDCKMSYLYA